MTRKLVKGNKKQKHNNERNNQGENRCCIAKTFHLAMTDGHSIDRMIMNIILPQHHNKAKGFVGAFMDVFMKEG